MRTQRAPISSRNLLTELHGGPTINEWETSFGDLIVYENDTIEAPGQISFRVLKRLGLGAYGHVYEVQEVTERDEDGPHYAMKISKSANIHRNVASQEANILNTIKRMFSPEELSTVSEIHATFSYHGHVCIVMELLGMNLYEVITLRRNRGMPLELISQVAKCTLIALSALHRIGYVHTDVKPENILIQSGIAADTKLCDFGSVKQIGDNYEQYVQTRYYRSPETILQLPFDEKIDIWSVGCVVAELFLGLPLLPGVNKENQLVLIDRMFGPFPESMVDACPIKDFYFEDGSMRSFAELCNDLGIPVPTEYNYHRFQTLPDIINGYGRSCDFARKQQMINFIESCLTLDPAQRPSASELLHHEFLNPME